MGRNQPLAPAHRVVARLAAVLLTCSLFSSGALTPSLQAAAPKRSDARLGAATCAAAPALALNADAAQGAAAGRWLKLAISEGQRYRLNVRGASGLTLHDRCADGATYAVRAGALEFTANRSGDLYLEAQSAAAGVASAEPLEVSLASAAQHPASRAVIARIPLAIQRRAIEFLEESRGSDLAPEWREARLSGETNVLYRPDVKGPAYYEFHVEKPSVTGAFVPAGFIELAAGDHDFPVTHWDATGKPPTTQLAELAPQGVTLTTFYKLDTLAYAAEYDVIIPLGISVAADNVVNLGDLPGRISGLENVPQKAAELVTETTDADGKTQHEGPTDLPATKQTDWGSWTALKDGFGTVYTPQLAALKQRASELWDHENSLVRDGESLIKGDVRIAYALPSRAIASYTVTGEGAAAQFLQSEPVTTTGQTTGVRLTVLDGPSDKTTMLPFQLALTYVSGGTETIKYAIINSALVNTNVIYLPFVSKDASEAGAASVASASKSNPAPSGWGPWSYWWADGDANSIRYGQFSEGGCASGCGGTAWAMLFAWTDRRAAEGHAPWTNHYGLYRANGSVSGANVVAPLAQDEGVKNMTREIRGQISTFCIFGSGATFPWNMIGAANYVRPRATAAWSMRTRYDPTGLCWFGACDGSRDLAREQIQNYHAPAVVGTGWLKHYPLAFGYAERSKRSCVLFVCWTDHSRWFYVNNGWYGNNNGWTSADVWFAGVYRP